MKNIICPKCKGNGFVWVETPEPKKDRWQTDCTYCDNQGEIKQDTAGYYWNGKDHFIIYEDERGRSTMEKQ